MERSAIMTEIRAFLMYFLMIFDDFRWNLKDLACFTQKMLLRLEKWISIISYVLFDETKIKISCVISYVMLHSCNILSLASALGRVNVPWPSGRVLGKQRVC